MPLLDDVAAALADEAVHLRPVDGEDLLQGALSVGDVVVGVSVVVAEDQQAVLVYAGTGLHVPPDRLALAAEVVARANWGLLGVTLELDWDDGEVRSRSSLDAQVQPVTGALLGRLVRDTVTTHAMYAPALDAVVAGTASPEQAVSGVEQD